MKIEENYIYIICYKSSEGLLFGPFHRVCARNKGRWLWRSRLRRKTCTLCALSILVRRGHLATISISHSSIQLYCPKHITSESVITRSQVTVFTAMWLLDNLRQVLMRCGWQKRRLYSVSLSTAFHKYFQTWSNSLHQLYDSLT